MDCDTCSYTVYRQVFGTYRALQRCQVALALVLLLELIVADKVAHVPQVVSKSAVYGLAALILLLGVTSLLVSPRLSNEVPVATCHQHGSDPLSPNPDRSDHLCCAVGHNHAVPVSQVDLALLQLGRLREPVSDVRIDAHPSRSILIDTSPPTEQISPLRI
jgi:hypothetical protein